MPDHCHRCHADLPGTASGGSRSDEPALFCPRCGAPQLRLPDHLRAQQPAGLKTTGTLPPPRPAGFVPLSRSGAVDWPAALPAAGLVAAVGATLTVAGLLSPVISLLGFFWTLGGAVIAVGLYARRRPTASMNGRIGLRVGVATGLGMAAATAAGLALTGVILRFGTHGLAAYDADWQRQLTMSEAMAAQWMQIAPGSKELQASFGMWHTPEGHAASALLQLVFLTVFLLLLSAGGGAFAGMLRGSAQPARPGLRERD